MIINDFTKEELTKLLNSHIDYCHMKIRKEVDLKLLNKLKSMIDNYCEIHCNHEWDGTLLTVKPNTGKCKKCGQVCYIAIKDIE